MNTISISDIQRNLHKIDDLDIVEVVDKKRHQVKGYFLDKKYRDVVEALFMEQEHQKNEKLKAFKKLRKHVSKIDPEVNLIKIEDEMNDDLF